MTATSRMMLMFEGAARNAVRAVKSSRRTILGFISSQYELKVLGRWICNSATDEVWRSRVKGFSGNYSQKYDCCEGWFLSAGDLYRSDSQTGWSRRFYGESRKRQKTADCVLTVDLTPHR